MSRKVFGLDIRNHSLAAVVVSSSLRENRVDAHTHIPISSAGENENGIAAALETLVQRIDIRGCDWVVSVPADRFSFRNLQVPFSNSKKIRMVLPFELEPTLPYQIDDLFIDFQTIDTVESGEKTALIAAAVEKSQLNPYIEALAAFKIDPEVVTVSGLPVALCLASQSDPGEDQLFIEIDEKSSTLFAIADGQIRLIRSFAIPTVSSSRSQVICTQIQRTLAAFEEIELSNFQPTDLFITGSGLNDAKEAKYIAAKLKIPVKAVNLANRLNIPVETHAGFPWKQTRMDNALALALMEIEDLEGLNFHKGQFEVQKFLAKNKSQVVKTGILAAAVLVLLLFNIVVESYTLQRRISRLDHQITEIYKSTFPEVKKIQDPYLEMQAKLKQAKKKSVFQSETGPHVRSIDILNNISERISKETVVDITRLDIRPQNVSVSGNTDTFNSVDDIKGRLEQIGFFKKVTISSSNKDRSGKNVRFMIKAEL
jgi:general secretion pathway protein L